MAGGKAAFLIPDLAVFRPEWLDSSEVSFSLDGPRVTGLSFFFQEEAMCAEFAASASLDAMVMPDEKALRAKYPILPRYWLKIHFAGMIRCGVTQYFHINPTFHYPITTIRCFLRSHGLSDAGSMEDLLKPSLEAHETQWGLAIKRFPGQSVPRVFFSIPRQLLSQALDPFIRFGYLSESAALLYLEWEKGIKAGERVFISLDPTLRKFSSLDYCGVSAEKFPGALPAGVPETFDYFKMRISDSSREPEFTAYMPFRKAEQLVPEHALRGGTGLETGI